MLVVSPSGGQKRDACSVRGRGRESEGRVARGVGRPRLSCVQHADRSGAGRRVGVGDRAAPPSTS